jgi:hypothetical protein
VKRSRDTTELSYFSSSTMSSTLSHLHFFYYGHGHRSFHSVEKLYREETLEVLLCEEWEFYYFAQWFIQSLGKFINYSCSDLVYYYFLSSSLAKKKKQNPKTPILSIECD